jgi:hypothetical protein
MESLPFAVINSQQQCKAYCHTGEELRLLSHLIKGCKMFWKKLSTISLWSLLAVFILDTFIIHAFTKKHTQRYLLFFLIFDISVLSIFFIAEIMILVIKYRGNKKNHV